MNRYLAGVLLCALLIVACSSDGDSADPEAASDQAVSSDAEPREPDDPTDEEPDEPVEVGPRGTIELAGWQQAHNSSAVAAVGAITVDESGDVFVDVSALAGRRSLHLTGDGAHLEDDLGNVYPYQPPETDPRIEVPPDHVVDSRLAFAGPIDPDATRLVLALNGRGELLPLDDRSAASSRPTFTFLDLPLPGVGLDDEAAGPDDTVGLDLDPQSVDVEGAVHEGPAQVRIEVTRVTATPAAVSVSFEARNEGATPARIGTRPPALRAEIDGVSVGRDALFELQTLTTAEGNYDRVELEPGEELSATLSYRGALPASATGVRLGFQTFTYDLDDGVQAEEREGRDPIAVFLGLPIPELPGVARLLETTGELAQRQASADEPSELDTRTDPLPVSTVEIAPVDPPLSEAEIRVGEIIIEFDGTVTDEGTVLTLEEPILFDFDSDELKSGAVTALDDIAEVLAFYPDAPIEVIGHTDDVGSADYNQQLSQGRADAVTAALEDRGIAGDRLSSEGRGLSQPIATNDTEAGRAQNRRVEVLIVGVSPPGTDDE